MNSKKTNELKNIVHGGNIKVIVMYVLNVIIKIYNEYNSDTFGPSNWGWTIGWPIGRVSDPEA